MTNEEKMAHEYAIENWEHYEEGQSDYDALKQAYLAGLEAGIGKLRYCCTCKKWHECKVVSMYGICADWEIKE